MLLPLLFALSLSQPADELIELTCGGGGSANRTSSSSAFLSDNAGNSVTGSVQSRVARGFADQVDLWIEADQGRIRLPRMMLPPIRGGENGWFKLKNIEIADRTIKASAAVNALNNPKIYIDRTTGSISIDGRAGHYSGVCERRAPSDARKF